MSNLLCKCTAQATLLGDGAVKQGIMGKEADVYADIIRADVF